jgi:two-component system chemotaxis response regulator CheB
LTTETAPEPWSAEDFRPIADILNARQGHALSAQRLTLIRARLQARLRAKGIPSFTWFHDRVLRTRPEGLGMQLLIDLSTVNHSSFFREPTTLRFAAERLAERLRQSPGEPVRAWTAGCAAGQEPYSLAITLAELIPTLAPGQVEIWATDLSLEMVGAGAAAIYDAKELQGVPPDRLSRFFLRGTGRRLGTIRVAPEIRRLVTFQRFDLRGNEWPIPGQFDAILCRNVTLYLPEAERVPLLDRMAERLSDGGWLVLGGGEILPGSPTRLEKVAPSIYRKAPPKAEEPPKVDRADRPAPTSRVEPARPQPRVTVLIVDDSAVVRQALKGVVEEDQDFRVQLAGDPYEAVAVMSRSAPGAILLDVNMPRMDGLTFLKKLMRQSPMPVVLCTDHPERGLAGLEMGAFEVIAKPQWSDPDEMVRWGVRLRESLRAAVGLHSRGLSGLVEPRYSADVILPRRPYVARGAPGDRVIAVGVSTGGVQAVKKLLADFPAESPAIVIDQHMPSGFTAAFASLLARDPKIAVDVREAEHGEPLHPGVALLIPGDAHGVLRRDHAGYRLDLVDGPPVSRHRPSVDVLFRSVAEAAGPHAAAVLLTGMGDDGAQGLLEVRESGGLTIAQDQSTSSVFGMPREAIRRGAARQVLPLHHIAEAVRTWSERPVG